MSSAIFVLAQDKKFLPARPFDPLDFHTRRQLAYWTLVVPRLLGHENQFCAARCASFSSDRTDRNRGDLFHVGFVLAAIAWYVASAVWIGAAEKLRVFFTTWLLAQVCTASWFTG
jgi:hypothetical protein